jgi:hypothetical protein
MILEIYCNQADYPEHLTPHCVMIKPANIDQDLKSEM